MRTRPFIVFLSLGVLAALPAVAADRVDLADLDALGDRVLNALKESHHVLALAEIHLAGAKQRENLVKDAVKSAKRDRGAEEADLKAARAELDAARKNRDEGRTRLAQVRLTEAERALDVAKAFQEWKDKEKDMAQEAIKLAESELDLRRAELEYARAKLVVEARIDAATRYALADFSKAADQARKKAAEARIKWERAADEARSLEAKWAALPKSSQE